MQDDPSPPLDPLSRSLPGEDAAHQRRSLELLAIAQEGDRDALEELIARYQDRLRRIVRIQLGASLLRRDYDSMDIVQNTFRAALPKIRDLQPESAASLLQWLAMIATNQIRDAYSYRRAAKRDAAREVRLDAPLSGAANVAPSTAGPAEQAFLAELRELLDDAVTRLPDDQRRVVVLRDYCGETWSRVAAELHRDSGAARQLHQRAWIRLRRELRPKLEGLT